MIRGGRPRNRTAIYMAMMSATLCNPKFKAIYHRLVAAGKPKKVAIIACIRKLIVSRTKLDTLFYLQIKCTNKFTNQIKNLSFIARSLFISSNK